MSLPGDSVAFRIPLDLLYIYRQLHDQFPDNPHMSCFQDFVNLVLGNVDCLFPHQWLIDEVADCYMHETDPNGGGDWIGLCTMISDAEFYDAVEQDGIPIEEYHDDELWDEMGHQIAILPWVFYAALMPWSTAIARLYEEEIVIDDVEICEDYLTLIYWVEEGDRQSDAYRDIFLSDNRPNHYTPPPGLYIPRRERLRSH